MVVMSGPSRSPLYVSDGTQHLGQSPYELMAMSRRVSQSKALNHTISKLIDEMIDYSEHGHSGGAALDHFRGTGRYLFGVESWLRNKNENAPFISLLEVTTQPNSMYGPAQYATYRIWHDPLLKDDEPNEMKKELLSTAFDLRYPESGVPANRDSLLLDLDDPTGYAVSLGRMHDLQSVSAMWGVPESTKDLLHTVIHKLHDAAELGNPVVTRDSILQAIGSVSIGPER